MARFDFSYLAQVSRPQSAAAWTPAVSRVEPEALTCHLVCLLLQDLHQKGLDNLHAAMQQTRTLCATVMDTLGPEIVVLNRCGQPMHPAGTTGDCHSIPTHQQLAASSRQQQR
jgi:hypothetical protein